ncbi:MAG: membrane integrity-associated transporter subunit PqiC [Burkholderiales bacterium]|nr:membrane integrity-associated transporter subunit PqiC [Burkholderiales bacterium]
MSEPQASPGRRRRVLGVWLSGIAALSGATVLTTLGACAAAPVPATVWLRLSAEEASMPTSPTAAAPAATLGAAGPASPSSDAAREVWQLMLPVVLPGHLERDALFVPQGDGGASGAWVRPLAGARWIEPLRDSVPRVLREDLMRRMDGQVLWWAPLPPGLAPTRQLRVEFAAFEIGADGRTLATHARWSIADARGARAPEVHEARIQTPAAVAGDPGAWALAHRQALSTLAARIAATMGVRGR